MSEAVISRLHGAFAPHRGATLIIAFSGGRDSAVLLHAATKLRSDLSLTLHAAHFNHHLRGNAERDAAFATEFARKLGVPMIVGHADSTPVQENREQWARRVRYLFLEQCREQVQGKFVVTAHHERDQVETLLFRMATGRWSGWGIAAEDQALLRPLLSVSADEIRRYAEDHAVPFVEDETNPLTSRGKIRSELIPPLLALNPSAERNFRRTADDLAEDEEYLREISERHVPDLLSFQSTELRSLPSPILRRVILGGVYALGGTGVSRGQRDQLLAALLDGKPMELSVSGGVQLRYTPSRGLERVGEVGLPLAEYPLKIPGETVLPFGEVRAEIWSGLPPFEATGEKDAFFDREQVSGAIVRSAKPGEVMEVFRRGKREVRKLFQEHRIPPEHRASYPVISIGGAIAWIPGVARGELATINDETSSVIKLSASLTSNSWD